jgi:hypothetical protein
MGGRKLKNESRYKRVRAREVAQCAVHEALGPTPATTKEKREN